MVSVISQKLIFRPTEAYLVLLNGIAPIPTSPLAKIAFAFLLLDPEIIKIGIEEIKMNVLKCKK